MKNVNLTWQSKGHDSESYHGGNHSAKESRWIMGGTELMLIGKKYKIESDELNVTIYRRGVAVRGKNAGGETWTPEGYFYNLTNALTYLVEREVKETELKDLRTVLMRLDEVKEEIKEATKDL